MSASILGRRKSNLNWQRLKQLLQNPLQLLEKVGKVEVEGPRPEKLSFFSNKSLAVAGKAFFRSICTPTLCRWGLQQRWMVKRLRTNSCGHLLWRLLFFVGAGDCTSILPSLQLVAGSPLSPSRREPHMMLLSASMNCRLDALIARRTWNSGRQNFSDGFQHCPTSSLILGRRQSSTNRRKKLARRERVTFAFSMCMALWL